MPYVCLRRKLLLSDRGSGECAFKSSNTDYGFSDNFGAGKDYRDFS